MSPLPDSPHLNRDYARLLLVMRKLIRNEYEVTLSLTQPETVNLLLHYARCSADHVLHEMANELEELLAQPKQSVKEKPKHTTMRSRDATNAVPLANAVTRAEEVTWYRGVPMLGGEVVVPHREE